MRWGAKAKKEELIKQQRVLTQEQDALLDLYIDKLDNYLDELKSSERVQVEIETLHLRKILSK